MVFGADRYLDALKRLLPTGAAWSTTAGSLAGLLAGVSKELARVDARADVLVREANPGEAVELLDDWERVLGLPGPCVTAPQTLAQRQAAAGTQFNLRGGQSAAWFVALAARLGYTVTVQSFSSAAAATAAGLVFSGSDWAYMWRMNVSSSTVERAFAVSESTVGEALLSWGDEQLECVVRRYSPAHTIVVFAYA